MIRRRDALIGLGAGLVQASAHAAGLPLSAPLPPMDIGDGRRIDVDYSVTLSPRLQTLTLDVHRPMELVPGVPTGLKCLKQAQLLRYGESPRALTVRDGRLAPQPVGTVRLTFDAGTLSQETIGWARSRDPRVRHLWPALWLWRPRKIRSGVRRIHFNLGPRALSTAWPRTPDGVHELHDSALRYKSRVIVGDFEHWTVPFARGEARVAWLGERPIKPRAQRWVQDALRGVAALHRHFPAQPQIVLFDEGGDEIGFGSALRGGGGGVSVWVGRDATPASIRTDWTLVHELLHLGMPHLQGADCWLSEGLTMYHTYVAQGRAGVLTPAQAWRKLHEGFERGRGSAAGRSLEAEAAQLDRYYNYWFVYWAGAAFALQLDLWLRQHGRDLSGLLAHWFTTERGCCDGERTAEALMASASDWVKSKVPASMAKAACQGTQLPDMGPIYADIGLGPDGRMKPGDTLARRIMSGR